MSVPISSLNGVNGFTIDGEAAGDVAGYWLQAIGDFDGDGIEDFAIGARQANSGAGQANSGRAYVVYGTDQGFPTTLDLASLDGTNGVIFNGVEVDGLSGRSVGGGGDFNGDGFADLVIGAPRNDGGVTNSGTAYVVWGGQSFAATGGLVAVSAIPGTYGFQLSGQEASGEFGWNATTAGDVNGDGFDDILVTAYREDPNGVNNAGSAYVVFGKDTTTTPFANDLDVSTLDGTDGFVLEGTQARLDGTNYGSGAANDLPHNFGYSANAIGDLNGDGIDDFAVAAFGGDGPLGAVGSYNAGEVFVFFGKTTGWAASFDVDAPLAGEDYIRFDGAGHNDRTGYSVAAAGDVNGDGFDDMIIGSRWVDTPGTDAGAAYVVYGRDGTTNPFALITDLASMTAAEGLVIQGAAAYDWTGVSARGIGDINGDGIDDIAVGADAEDQVNSSSPGKAFVVFGSATFGATFDLASLSHGVDGLEFSGIAAGDRFGRQVDGADLNDDGVNDLIIGAELADVGAAADAGQTYVVFGQSDGVFSFSDPVATGTSGTGDEETDILGTVTATDADVGNVVTFALDSGPANGTAVVLSDGNFTYTPDVDFFGTDSFVVLADDGKGGTDTATVSLTVNNVNDAPVATSDTPSGNEDDTITGTVTATDADPADTVTFAKGTDSANGAVTVNPDGTYSYVPDADYFGADAFDVVASDGNGGTDTVTVTVTVANVNDAPVATGDTGVGVENQVLSGTVTATDADPGDILTFSVATGPANGTAVVNPDGTWTYTPGASYNGLDAFEVGVDDGNGGTDTVTVSVTVNGGSGDDFITGSAADELLEGFSGNDTIVGQGGNDTLDGGSGKDSLIGGTGSNVLIGSSGDDTLDNTGADASTLDGGSGSDLLIGGILADSLEGGSEGDTIFGGGGNDTINGGSGNDLIDGGTGVDQIDGGDGDDTIDASNGADVSVTGGTGDDRIKGGGGNDIAFGGSENDTLLGGANNDSLEGESGNDRLFGELGRDTLVGGDGDDSLEGGNSNDQLFGGAGDDTLFGQGSGDTLDGGIGNDSLNGGASRDYLYGGDGNDSLDGGAFNDILNGDAGMDSLLGSSGLDTIFGGADADYIDGGSSGDVLHGDGGNDTILGGIGADSLLGGDGDDSLSGGNSNDTISGGAGADTALGGSGSDLFVIAAGEGGDVLSGEAGLDRFDFETGFGTTTITDFSIGQDTIDVVDVAAITGFADLAITYGVDATVDMGGGDIVTLTGITAGLTASDFAF